MALPAIVGRPVYYRLYQLAWAGLDWLYPPLCGGCGKHGSRWCEECQSTVGSISEPICYRCGQMTFVSGVCTVCQKSLPHYTLLRGWTVYGGPLRNAVRRLKYKRDLALGELLARYLIGFLRVLAWPIDLIVPVPMGKARKAERGYNQAAFLALPLALGCRIPYQPKALIRSRQTRSQVGLTTEQRRVNVAGAFKANPDIVRDKTVLVVDDVATSGATMDACALALKDAGAAVVYGLALARASRDMQGYSGS